MAYLDFDPRTTALLIIDMQNGYCHPEGGLAKGGADNSRQQAIVGDVKRLVQICRHLGVHIVWCLQEHYPDDVTRKRKKIPSHLDKRGIYPAMRLTWDAELVQSLREEALPEDHYVRKHRMSALYNTNLEVLLRMLGVNHVIISGVSTNVCVESTIRDAYFRDFDITVVRECVAGSFPDLDEATLKNVEIYFGQVISLGNLGEKAGL